MLLSILQIAWALNKGIKPDYKQYWDVELGVTYIPWSKVKPEDLESFCEGGMLDNETLSPGKMSLGKLFLFTEKSSICRKNNFPCSRCFETSMLHINEPQKSYKDKI